MITSKTRLLIVNDLQNPSGAEAGPGELEAIAALAIKHDLFVLADEAYFDIRYSGKSRSLVSLPGMEERSLILYTFSKKFSMTGWRLGAAVGPKPLIDTINDESCSPHFTQFGGIEALTGDPAGSAAIVRALKERRDKAVQLLNAIPGVKCFKPEATFYLFPNVTELMNRKGLSDYETFRKAVLHATGVSFCTRRHFGRPQPDEREFFIRLAYSGISVADIEEGLGKFKIFAESSL
jgi:aspartate/methionine/tyrosine aminotransferase